MVFSQTTLYTACVQSLWHIDSTVGYNNKFTKWCFRFVEKEVLEWMAFKSPPIIKQITSLLQLELQVWALWVSCDRNNQILKRITSCFSQMQSFFELSARWLKVHSPSEPVDLSMHTWINNVQLSYWFIWLQNTPIIVGTCRITVATLQCTRFSFTDKTQHGTLYKVLLLLPLSLFTRNIKYSNILHFGIPQRACKPLPCCYCTHEA